MISAEEARKLQLPDPEVVKDHLRIIETAIKRDAPSKSETIIRTEPYCRWLYDSERTPTVSAVIDELTRLGYTLDLYYQERQFVDMGLRIRW